MYCEAYSAVVCGIEGHMIQAETDVSEGLPCFMLVGFLSSEVKEARERVRIAIKNSGFKLPPKKITVNLSPADIRKDGTGYDFAIAVAILGAFGYVDRDIIHKIIFIGELGLDGFFKAVNGVLPMVYTAFENGIKYCMVPVDNANEAMFVTGMKIIAVDSLCDAVDILNSGMLDDYAQKTCSRLYKSRDKTEYQNINDFADIKGQAAAKRATKIAVAGMHNLLIIGPPGTGKTMIAKCIADIMPEISLEECIEISKVYSVAGLLDKDMPIISKRPFRAPHHTITQTALSGGGRYPKPGEISLASGGVLFLDELPEFQKQTLEVLRQPLEEGYVNVSRLEGSYRYPAKCQLIAAMNPCRCGFYPDKRKCLCTPIQVKNYLDRVSRPFLDRIDICTETVSLKFKEIYSSNKYESSISRYSDYNISSVDENNNENTHMIRGSIKKLHEIQKERYKNEDFIYNSQLTVAGIDKYCILTEEAHRYIKNIFDSMEFSARAYHKILKVGRTIADMENSEKIDTHHIAEAACYRSIDRKYWN